MNLEVLAPAGNMQALDIAINNGADAVYLGLKGFNARAKAENFTCENIKDVVKKAHLFGVKVYVTVNTLVNNDEMVEFLNVVKSAVNAGVDAFLVQDFGAVTILKKCFPNICLHASTQMGVHNLRGAKMAERMGISRVVLSREAKLEDIIAIKQQTNLEIEYFVQGALCVAFSGNCYFSALKSQSSGNRGLCKQYCRMPYYVKQDGVKSDEMQYLLSPADLCLLKNLKTLVDAGVTSFKIEGRLRREGYVAWAVDVYRRAIDFLMGKEKTFDEKKEILNLKKVFSRGDFNYNAYLMPNVPNNVINKKTQNHTGIFVGKIVETKPFKDLNKVVIQSTKALNFGDGLKFYSDEKEMLSLGVGNVDCLGNGKYQIYTKHNVKKGWDVNLILDFESEKAKIENKRKIFVSAKVVANAGTKLAVEFCTDDGFKLNYESDFVCEKPKNCALTKEQFEEQIKKLGDTCFELSKCVVETDGVFVPKSILNELRRNGISKLENLILKARMPKAFVDEIKILEIKNAKNNCKKLKNSFKNVIVFDNFDVFDIDFVKNQQTLFVYSPQNFFEKADVFKDFCKKHKDISFGLNLPVVANGEDLKIIDKFIKTNSDVVLVANNIYALSYCFENRKVFCGTGLNFYNNFAEEFFAECNIVGAVISIEQQLNKMEVGSNCVYSYGKPTVMTFCHCPYKTVYENDCANCKYGKTLSYVDANGREYKIRRYQISQCYFELLNDSFIQKMDSHNFAKFIDIRELDFDLTKQLLSKI